MKNRLWKNKEILKVIGVLTLLYTFFAMTGIGCPIRCITGISCAGCGMTRAVLQALHGNFREAFRFHPLWPLVFTGFLCLPLFRKFSEKGKQSVLFFTVILFFIVYFHRLFDPVDAIVTFRPQNGLLARLLLNGFNILHHL